MEKENLLSRITINANICHGKPTIRGLRYPVENMLELLAADMTHEEILADYPDLVKEDLLACLAYAVRVTQTKAVYPLAFMKFIIDAQPRGGPLPQLLAVWLEERGFDAIHILELPAANRSDDKEIIVVADQDDRVIVSKDSDFFDDHILMGKPKRLLVVKTGNIKNRDLIRLFEKNIERIEGLFKRYVLIEMNRSELIVHR